MRGGKGDRQAAKSTEREKVPAMPPCTRHGRIQRHKTWSSQPEVPQKCHAFRMGKQSRLLLGLAAGPGRLGRRDRRRTVAKDSDPTEANQAMPVQTRGQTIIWLSSSSSARQGADTRLEARALTPRLGSWRRSTGDSEDDVAIIFNIPFLASSAQLRDRYYHSLCSTVSMR